MKYAHKHTPSQTTKSRARYLSNELRSSITSTLILIFHTVKKCLTFSMLLYCDAKPQIVRIYIIRNFPRLWSVCEPFCLRCVPTEKLEERRKKKIKNKEHYNTNRRNHFQCVYIVYIFQRQLCYTRLLKKKEKLLWKWSAEAKTTTAFCVSFEQ